MAKKQENERLQARIESLQKDITVHRIEINGEEGKRQAKMEEA